MSSPTPLDLHSLCTLLNYERSTTDPRFTGTKLRELVFSEPWATIALPTTAEDPMGSVLPERGILWSAKGVRVKKEQRDSMEEMMHPAWSETELGEMERETLWWESRGHDSCYKVRLLSLTHSEGSADQEKGQQVINILQNLFDSYPPSHPLLIRLHTGQSFTIPLSSRVITEYTLHEPRHSTRTVILKEEGANRVQVLTTGERDFPAQTSGWSMPHAVLGFGAPEAGQGMVTHILDLASMQFGEFGRGYAGESFRLGSFDEMHDGFERFCGGVELKKGGSARIGSSGDEGRDTWMRDVARRVRERWEKRDQEKWCGYCGRPAPPSRCGACR